MSANSNQHVAILGQGHELPDHIRGNDDPLFDWLRAHQPAGSDIFTVSFTADPVATNVRADALQAYLAFYVYDEDVTSHDAIGACVTNVTEAAFAGTLQTMNCPRNPSRMQSGFTLTWRLVRY